MPTCTCVWMALGRGNSDTSDNSAMGTPAQGELTPWCHTMLCAWHGPELVGHWCGKDRPKHCLWWGDPPMSPVSPSWTDPVGAAAFYCHGGFHTGQTCCHHSCQALPRAGACCSLESITHASTCPSRRKNISATHCKGRGPATREAPRGGTEVLWAGCSWRWFSSFPLWSQLLLS